MPVIIDLSQYHLIKSDMSTCSCGETLFILALRTDLPHPPGFFLCTCGLIHKPGEDGVVAPRMPE